MFFRIASIVALAVAVAAAPNGGGEPTKTVTVTEQPTSTPIPASQCSTGPVQCCSSVESASSSAGGSLLGLLGIALSDLNVLIGSGCSPLEVIGVGSGCNANAQAVCCQNNDFNGLIVIGCTPVNVQL